THRLFSSLAYEDPNLVKRGDRGYELDPRLRTGDFLRKALYGRSKRHRLLEGLEDRENIRASRNAPVSNANVGGWPELESERRSSLEHRVRTEVACRGSCGH